MVSQAIKKAKVAELSKFSLARLSIKPYSTLLPHPHSQPSKEIELQGRTGRAFAATTMNITLEKPGAAQTQPFPNPPPPSDLLGNPDFERKPHRRRKKAPGALSVKWSSRPEPPLLKWKFNDCCGEYKSVEKDKSAGEAGRKCQRRTRSVASARNLPAGISRLGLPEFDSNAGRREAARGKKAISKHSQWRNYDDLNEYFW
ncbi:hypothetical protein CASFOL_001949 [Castilleja foliolosa]|uniref:Uncharacterized protein n=1 Tax=Castilleja foliolosa TaxID=1961234 RepID=A0ABD3ECV9_9LAMI